MSREVVVLFDLDHTLYEAYWSWRRALQHVFVRELGFARFPYSAYFAVRAHSELFEIFFEKSFRHFWATPELLSIMFLLLNVIEL